jgi:hypothetical protein
VSEGSHSFGSSMLTTKQNKQHTTTKTLPSDTIKQNNQHITTKTLPSDTIKQNNQHTTTKTLTTLRHY